MKKNTWKGLSVVGVVMATLAIGGTFLAAGEKIGDIKDNTAAIEIERITRIENERQQKLLDNRQEELLQEQRTQTSVIISNVEALTAQLTNLNEFLRRFGPPGGYR